MDLRKEQHDHTQKKVYGHAVLSRFGCSENK